MLTAKGQKDDVVRGFEIGADDYLIKPYDKDEFEARIKALLRRFPASTSNKNKRAENVHISHLYELLVEYFSNEELHTLSSIRLGVDYESLQGAGKASKARELIMYLKRHGKIRELIKIVKELRPHVIWPKFK